MAPNTSSIAIFSFSFRDLVGTFINTFVAQNKRFTAYDVTTAMREAGHYAKHDAVRPVVHEIMPTIVGYTRNSELVADGVYAEVYRPLTDWTPYYTSPVVEEVDEDTEVSELTKFQPNANELDNRGRYRVKADDLRKIGVNSGDKVWFRECSGNILEVTKEAPYAKGRNSAYDIFSLNVEKDGSIRIPANRLQHIGLTEGNIKTLAYPKLNKGVLEILPKDGREYPEYM